MSKIRIRETILKGNNEKLEQIAKQYGLKVEDFFYMLATVDWYCLSRDVIMQKKIEGKKIPTELENDEIPKIIQIKEYNTEPLSVYVEQQVELGLLIKSKQYGLRNIGVLIDKICSETIQFMNPDLINGIKKKGGKK